MSEYQTPYVNPYNREDQENPNRECPGLILNPWTVQNVALEIVQNHFLHTDPAANGFAFNQKYDPDLMKSGVFVAIAYDWNAKVVNQRPAVIVNRSEARTAPPIMNQTIGMNVKESEKEKMSITYMNIGVSCLATNLGFCEMLAEYVKTPFLAYQEQIQEDFKFRRFRLENVSAPAVYPEAKDNHVITLTISTVYDEAWLLKGDHLKIKTISKTIFDSLTSKPLLNQ